MHIPDGFLSGRIALSMIALSGATVLYAAHRVREELSGRMVPTMGVLSAFVLAAQMLNFPILGGTSGHLLGGALLGILLGPMAGFLAMTTVIVAQALFFQDGGLIAIGANTFNIAAVTVFTGSAVFRGLAAREAEGRRLAVASFAAGWISSVLSAACCALSLALSGSLVLRVGLPAMAGYHAVIGVAEGVLTAGILSFLVRVRRDLVYGSLKTPFAAAEWVGALVLVAAPVLVLALAGSSELPDPLQSLIGSEGEPVAAAGELASPDRLRDSLGLVAVILGISVGAYATIRLSRLWKRKS